MEFLNSLGLSRHTPIRNTVFIIAVAITASLTLLSSSALAKGYKVKKQFVSHEVSGLQRPARILVDKWGIPHMYAKNLHDVFFLQGFNAARDRLWQIDLWRKRGLGLLSEVFGPSFVEKDRASRLFLYRGDMTSEWLAYGEDAQIIAEAFVKGLNEYVKLVRKNPDLLPIEFRLLGYEPDLWRPEDVVLIRSHGLVRNVSSEVTRSQVYRDFGPDVEGLRQKLDPPWELVVPDGMDLELIPTDVLEVYNLATGGVEFTPDILLTARKDPKEFRDVLTKQLTKELPANLQAVGGSNNWAISPFLTRTGRAILANDPHRLHSVPSLRYIAHLKAPGLNVIGAGEPFLPGISIGHNERIAFGLTIFSIDQEDLYVYTTNPANPNEYKYKGGWESMTVIHETIPVDGNASVDVELKFTRHGPVIYEDPSSNVAFAVRAAWLEPGMAPYFGSIDYMRAQNWEEFLAAMKRWGSPSENQVYADIHGNIGWKPGGKTPIRPNWDGLFPVPGDGQYEWAGFRDMDELPVEYNPGRGWIATANEMNLPDDYPYEEVKLGFEWMDPSRYQRIAEVLSSASEATVNDSLLLQGDFQSIPARRVVALLTGLSSGDPTLQEALNRLRTWDFVLSAESKAAALFEVWWHQYLRRDLIFRLAPPPAWGYMASFLGWGDPQVMLDLLENPDDRFGPDPEETRDQILLFSLEGALDYLESNNIQTWGDLHMAYFAHALSGVVSEEDRELLDVGPPSPKGGSGDTVNATFHVGAFDLFGVFAGASWRMVVDVGKWDKSIAMNTPGQSGDPNSHHYKDLFQPWLHDEAIPLLFSRKKIRRATKLIIWLKPSHHDHDDDDDDDDDRDDDGDDD